MPDVTKSITLQEDKPSLWVNSRSVAFVTVRCDRAQRLILREQSDFANFEVLSCLEKLFVHKCWSPSFFALRMSNIALAPTFLYILWIELGLCMRKAITSMTIRKIVLAKTIWFFHTKSSLFNQFFIHSLHLTCHVTSPMTQGILLSKRTSRLYESYLWSRAALILREQSDFANFEVLTTFHHHFQTLSS